MQAAELVLWAAETLQFAGKELWAVVDGAYAKRPFVLPVMALGVTLVGRLRKDSALHDLPPVEKTRRRGWKRKYGKNRISLAKRAVHRDGWENITCTVYGVEVIKRVKTFLATHRVDSPWDTAERRPSHADRRKVLQAACLAEEFSHRAPHGPDPRKFRTLLKRLLRLAD